MKLNRAAFLLLLGVTIFQSCNRDFGVSRQIDELPAIFPIIKELQFRQISLLSISG